MEKNDNKKETASGGMYRGIDIPVKLLDAFIVTGIVLMAVLIFG